MKAFTLIEVVIAVALAFVITGVAMYISGNAKKLFILSRQNSIFAYKASVAALEKHSSNVYEMLRDFNITNDNVISNLKKQKLEVKKSVEYSQKFGNNLQVVLYKYNIYDKHNSIRIYVPDIK